MPSATIAAPIRSVHRSAEQLIARGTRKATSKISEDRFSTAASAGCSEDAGVSGHKWILQGGLPRAAMEFAVEATKLLSVSLEGSVG